MNALEALRAARARIEKPESWGKGHGLTPPREPALCALGALIFDGPHAEAIARLREALGTSYVHKWNDAPERTHAEVLAAFDRAIELASASGCTDD